MKRRNFFPLLLFFSLGQFAYAGVEFVELMDAISIQDLKQVQSILSDSRKRNEINLDEKNAEEWTPLTLAAAMGNPQIFQSLLDAGAHLDQFKPFQGKKATPFILAAQYHRAPIMQMILKSALFTPELLKQEIRNAYSMNQPILGQHLFRMAHLFHSKNSSSSLTSHKRHRDDTEEKEFERRVRRKVEEDSSLPSSSPDVKNTNDFHSDPHAQTYVLMNESCAVCLGTPGMADQEILSDGSSLNGDSAITSCCLQFYCKACLEQWIDHNPNCPSCRTSLDQKPYKCKEVFY